MSGHAAGLLPRSSAALSPSPPHLLCSFLHPVRLGGWAPVGEVVGAEGAKREEGDAERSEELAALDGAVGLPSSNGHASPAVVEKSEDDGVVEVKGEASHNSKAGPGEQGTAAAGELDAQDAPAELRIDHAEAEDDSAPPAVESVLTAKDGESEKSVATEVVAPEEQQDGDNAPAESSGLDEPPRHAESVSVVLESEGSVEQSKGEEMFDDQDLGFFTNFLGIFIFVLVIAYHFVMADPKSFVCNVFVQMFDDQDLGFFTNFLGIFIFVLVIAYHFVMADPKYKN
ncbi:hypothetical protein ZWY2020_009445 [Hordeum vulgare]|nr:hypothetical protein ZWY2020_009445 [Hordeum vulgare]